ncbi:N-acetylmuramidase family protein [Pseudomonas kuykendallii]|uniref:Peptidoglycan-binding (PGRP) domain of peptidoglycan hydrolases-containing protein n=1 Tax=Pseudomonas kuykendallii TaxID=1007099 RepID=A0A1H3DKT8_9PSED|nr:N-acetylmuramidase family protein [Pseudomonas kuykendallii]MCQ4270266.1 N-acetylmuramidase family protein [Pseudomonas kuykendallii]SDX66244.1 Peptidoglycan-binding (PGRP) domain of peptidoglycan hydrolases-containing protein [Pseudomonas kuykendallii]
MTTLRHGDRNAEVRLLQQRLNARAGAGLFVDGDYGDTTEAAVRAYQLRVGLVADGIAGSKTLATLAGADCSALLHNATLAAAATRLGVELATIYAVNEVESQGEGFLSPGRPKILFERHVMYQRIALPRSPGDDASALQARADRLAAQFPALVNARPGGYAGGAAEHQRLASARQIDAQCAPESASWGAFQIMGYHALRLGYASVDEFVRLMSQDENQQFEAFVRFIEAEPALLKALKARKWAAFARGYNGPNYARNLYDSKLEEAYRRHASCCAQEAA